MSGWYGVDLDGTLAYYSGWISETHIGAPIPLMVIRVQQWLAMGREVKIFTARIAAGQNFDGTPRDMTAVRHAIEAWCILHIGQALPITNIKDFGMVELWDDRAVQVQINTGIRMDGHL